MTRKPLFAAAGALVLASLSTPALADRKPSPDELTKIVAVLAAAGYEKWDEIQLDKDGPFWEVDDARRRDGKRHDLKLSPNDYGIIEVGSD